MKVFGAVLLVLLVAGIAIYADGARLPYDHSVSVTGVVAAPQEKVFALITNVAHGSDWRPAVKSVSTLEPDKGRDHWVEHLDHGQFMTFLATRTEAPTRREVLLDDPGASYGGRGSMSCHLARRRIQLHFELPKQASSSRQSIASS